MSGLSVVMTAWRRPYYLEPVLASWARACELMAPDRFVISLRADGGPYEEMLAVIDKARPSFPVELEILPQGTEGVHHAYGAAVGHMFSEPAVEFVAVGEEDVLVSDDVLLYMEWARRGFERAGDVLLVCAHSEGGQFWDQHVPVQDADADQQVVRVRHWFNAWGWGTWRDCWEQVLEPGWCWQEHGYATGYDFAMNDHIMSGKYRAVMPDASRSQNIGDQGGLYATPETRAFSQAQSFREHRGRVVYRLEEDR